MPGSGNVLLRTVVAVVLTGAGAAACGGREPAVQSLSPASRATPTAASGTTAPGTATTAAPGIATASPGATRSTSAGIPIYEPSSVVGQTSGATVLTSPDSVEEVSDFYADALERGDWSSISRNITQDSATYTVGRSGRGATIAISPSASGTVITISRYRS